MRCGRAMLALAVLGLPACSDIAAPTAGRESSYLTARVRGAVNVDYLGSGRFHVGPVPQRSDAGMLFTIMSESAGGPRRVLQVFGELPALPGPGTLPIGLGPGELRAVFYSRVGDDGEALEAYAASSGELRITASSAERVRGELSFGAFRYCAPEAFGEPCAVPAQPIQGSPGIEVSGSFDAERFREGMVPTQ